MSLFGWSYPAGAENDPNAPWNQPDPQCEVCGEWCGDCQCPECPKCGEAGNLKCEVNENIENKACEECGAPPSAKNCCPDPDEGREAQIEKRRMREEDGY